MCVITCPWLVWWFAHYYGKVFIIDWDESNAFCNTIRNNMDSVFASDALHVEELAKRFFNSFGIYVVPPYGLTGPYTMRHGGSQGDSMGVGLYSTTTCARTKFHQGILLQHKNPADLSPRAAQYMYKSLAAPWDPSVKALEIVYNDDRRGFATSPQDMAHMYNTFNHGCWWTRGSSQYKIKMYGAEPRKRHTRVC